MGDLTGATTNLTSNDYSLELPIIGTRNAPRKFKGQYTYVKPFLRHYEKLCAKHSLTTQKEMCINITQYCSRPVKECIKGLPGYEEENWNKLKREIEKYFDAEREDKHYSEKDLIKYCNRCAKKSIKSLAAWKRYMRGFYAIATPLKSNQNISETQMNKYFWQGLRKSMRDRLEDRLLSQDNTHDLEEPFEINNVDKVVTNLLHRNRFDADLRSRDIETSDSEDNDMIDSSESLESESDFSDDYGADSSDESDDIYSRKKRYKVSRERKKYKKNGKDSTRSRLTYKRSAKHKVMPNQNEKVPSESKKDEPQSVQANQDEIEALIKQLNSMSLNDPSYGLTYYKAIKLDPDVAKVVRMPQVRNNNNPSGVMSRPSSLSPSQSTIRCDEAICFGCGKKGHSMNVCSTINELINKGTITRDASGRIVMKNGNRMIRMNGEPFITAIERQLGMESHFVGIPVDVAYTNYLSDTESDIENFAYNLQRRVNNIKHKGREVLDGVYPPPLRNKEKYKTGAIPKPVPVEVHKPVYDPTQDDAIMEDSPLRTVPHNEAQELKDVGDKKRPPGRQSAVSAQVRPVDVMNKILNTLITLAVGEVMGVSKDVSSLIQDILKPKTQPAKIAAATASYLIGKTRGTLIRLNVECDNVPISAIVDTGSQLNIISKQLWRTLGRPMDVGASVAMNDANGGEGVLRGLVQEVPLTCGAIKTYANLYVGEHVPFDLLLGRPWQRGNYISIDERADGTYLLFKDQSLQHTRYEILVSPEGSPPIAYQTQHKTPEINICALFTEQESPGQNDTERRERDRLRLSPSIEKENRNSLIVTNEPMTVESNRPRLQLEHPLFHNALTAATTRTHRSRKRSPLWQSFNAQDEPQSPTHEAILNGSTIELNNSSGQPYLHVKHPYPNISSSEFDLEIIYTLDKLELDQTKLEQSDISSIEQENMQICFSDIFPFSDPLQSIYHNDQGDQEDLMVSSIERGNITGERIGQNIESGWN